MTGTQELTDFVDALDDLIESALARARDPDGLLDINQKISNLVETSLPPLVEALDVGNLAPEARELLKEKLASVRDLENKARARLAWSRDFEDYIRDALSEGG